METNSFKSQIDVNKVLFWVLLLYLFWQIKRGWDKSKTQVYSENAGSDLSTQQAIQFRQAMNPSGSGWLMSFDGTDTASILATAGQIKSFADVSQAYRALYGDDLTSDLTNELSREDLAQLWAIINGTKATTTTGGTSTGTTSGTTTTQPATTATGKMVTATTTANIRIDKAPYGVETDFLGRNIQAKKGQVLGKYVSEKVIPDVPNKGNRNTFVRYAETSLGGLVTSYHWIVKTAVSIK
ncbi:MULTISPECIES: hypothetical protein [unclassified Spirosoma]|uniref:hypothetical protein n=1 Tax=unclassified Spirosoma TaxID=2621999 RepID=UPI000967958D|nr:MULTISPECIES: hypothetical protein [unclassified Spirosoma]MBN8823883.1 hypothetical protein [Spirosoma sp.]OJW79725.1 MAG: hypothetical protein BGO59_00280 [Spirosoma sp. 48-14]